MSDLVDSLCTWGRERRLDVEVSTAGDVAVYSQCLRLRYALTRRLGEGERVLVGCGLNPSTATAAANDRTISKVCAFGRLWGCGLYVMLNAYAWRATDPDDMKAAANRGNDVTGEANNAVIDFVLRRAREAPGEAPIALAMWGVHAADIRQRQLQDIAANTGVSWQCLKLNQGGSPGHPLYLPMTSELRPWPEAAP